MIIKNKHCQISRFALICGVILAFASADALADEDKKFPTGTLSIKFSLKSTDTPEYKPTTGVFVFLRWSLRIPNAERIRSLISSYPPPPKNVHHFSVDEDGLVHPKFVLMRTGDEIAHPNKLPYISFIGAANMPRGPTVPPGQSRNIRLEDTEPTVCTIELDFFNKGKYLAYGTVLDHPISAISNEQGIATIENFPADLEVTMWLFAPLLQNTKYECEALKLNGSRFAVNVPADTHVTYTVYVTQEQKD